MTVTSILQYMLKHVQSKGTVYKGDEFFFFFACGWVCVSVLLGPSGHQHLSDVVLRVFNAALQVCLLLLWWKQRRED